MKNSKNFFFLIILISFSLTSCMYVLGFLWGGFAPGYIAEYEFGISKYKLEEEIKKIFKIYPNYNFPQKWKKYANPGYENAYWYGYTYKNEYDINADSLKKVYIYLKQVPEELYRVRFAGGEEYWKQHPNNSFLQLEATVKWGKEWRYFDRYKFWYRGKKRVQKRFETEILSKIPYSYTKTDGKAFDISGGH